MEQSHFGNHSQVGLTNRSQQIIERYFCRTEHHRYLYYIWVQHQSYHCKCIWYISSGSWDWENWGSHGSHQNISFSTRFAVLIVPSSSFMKSSREKLQWNSCSLSGMTGSRDRCTLTISAVNLVKDLTTYCYNSTILKSLSTILTNFLETAIVFFSSSLYSRTPGPLWLVNKQMSFDY